MYPCPSKSFCWSHRCQVKWWLFMALSLWLAKTGLNWCTTHVDMLYTAKFHLYRCKRTKHYCSIPYPEESHWRWTQRDQSLPSSHTRALDSLHQGIGRGEMANLKHCFVCGQLCLHLQWRLWLLSAQLVLSLCWIHIQSLRISISRRTVSRRLRSILFSWYCIGNILM